MEQSLKEKSNTISNQVIGAAIEVHRHLGPGLLESAYEACLCHELNIRGIRFHSQVNVPVLYKAKEVETAFRIDLIVDELVIVELKAVERLDPIHFSQLLTYLRLKNVWLGLLINFNVDLLKDGIHRVVNG